MWQAAGTLYGQDVTLAYGEDGPVDWPSQVRSAVQAEVDAGTRVGYTVTGPFHPLRLDDPTTLAVWLAQQGLTLTGAVPRPERPQSMPPGVVF